MPFQKGQSGNPAGRPRGIVNRATALAQNLLSEHAEWIARKVIELAEEGDMAAIRVCMERLVPPIKHQPVAVELPPIEKPADRPRPPNWPRSSMCTCGRSTAKASTSA